MVSWRRRAWWLGFAVWLSAGCVAESGTDAEPDAGVDAGGGGQADVEPLRVCDPVSEPCGGRNWQFSSDPACPEEVPTSGEACEDLRVACYYCEDPSRSASESGLPFTIKACAPDGTWERQVLTCAE